MVTVLRKQARLSNSYEKLGHLSLNILKLLHRSEINPKELANVDAPIYPGCAYGKAHRKSTRSKGVENKKKLRTSTTPGQFISVDQHVSPIPDFIPNHQGRPMAQCYVITTVFFDHFYNFTDIQPMKKLDG